MDDLRSPSRRALSIAEIVGSVLQHLVCPSDDVLPGAGLPFVSPSLLACTTVSRELSARALDLLWRATTPWRLARLITLAKHPHRYAEYDPLKRYEVFLAEEVLLEFSTNVRMYHVMLTYAQSYMQADPAPICTAESLLAASFHHYSRRVKRLCWPRLESDFPGFSQLDHQVFDVWRTSQRILFPQMTGLWVHIHEMHNTILPNVLQFVHPFMHHLFILGDLGSLGSPNNVLATVPVKLAQLHTFECHSAGLEHLESQIIAAAPLLRTVRSHNGPDWLSILHLSQLPELQAPSIARFRSEAGEALQPDAFSQLDTVYLAEDGAPGHLLREFATHASTQRMRAMSLCGKVAWSVGEAILTGAGRFRGLATLYLQLDIVDGGGWPGDGSFETRATLTRGFIQPLRNLVTLADLFLKTNIAFAFALREFMSTVSGWPRVRFLTFGNASHRLFTKETVRPAFGWSALAELVALCPYLTDCPVVLDCSEPPTEDTVLMLERLRPPFKGPLVVRNLRDVEAHFQATRRALPGVLEIQSKHEWREAQELSTRLKHAAATG
jgi:hypothetical protein